MLVNAVTASLICSPSTEIPLPQCFDVLIKHCRSRLVKKRSRALSPPLFLSDRVQCVVVAGGWGRAFFPDNSSSAKNDDEGCVSLAHSTLMSHVVSHTLSVLSVGQNNQLSTCLYFLTAWEMYYVTLCICHFNRATKKDHWQHCTFLCGFKDPKSCKTKKWAARQSPSLSLSLSLSHPIKEDPSSLGLFSWVNMRVTVDLSQGQAAFILADMFPT